jgi:hypothetical protein
MPTIVTRAGKGSALTWTEGDANINNLNTAIDNIVAGTQAVGLATNADNIDIASIDGNTADTAMSVVLVANQATGNQAPHIDAGLTYNASTNTLTATTFSGALTGNATTATTATTATGATNINISTTNGNSNDATLYPVLVGANTTGNQLPHTDISDLTYSANSGTLSAAGFNGTFNGTLSVNAYTIGATVYIPLVDSTGAGQKTFSVGTTISATNGVISASQGFSGPLNGTVGATTASTGAFTTLSASSTVSGAGFTTRFASPGPIGSTTASTGAFTTLTATGAVTLSPASLAVAISPTGTGTVAISPAGALTINPTTASTINNTSIGSTTRGTGAFTTLTADTTTLDDIRETIFALTYAATITPDAANGSIQTVTLTGNVIFSAFANPVSGQTITLIITQDATGSRTLTSTMKFAGASKTLSTAANSIDILTVSYIGTTYYASLAKGFA